LIRDGMQRKVPAVFEGISPFPPEPLVVPNPQLRLT
jgi:hypothetical protein